MAVAAECEFVFRASVRRVRARGGAGRQRRRRCPPDAGERLQALLVALELGALLLDLGLQVALVGAEVARHALQAGDAVGDGLDAVPHALVDIVELEVARDGAPAAVLRSASRGGGGRGLAHSHTNTHQLTFAHT